MPKIIRNLSIFLALGIFPLFAHAATLQISPTSGDYTVGTIFSVDINVQSPDKAINAASGILSFPPDKLEVVFLSKTGSVLTLWAQEPSFSNTSGTVNFAGIVLNPGYIGESGKIISVNFRVKATGLAPVSFTSGSTLANDGQGTNILTGLGTATYNLDPQSVNSLPTPTLPSSPVPQIFSSTHPDQNKWYSVKDAQFTWTVPKGVVGVRHSIDNLPDTIPTKNYLSSNDSAESLGTPDGVWYFHLRFKDANGWGDTAHFRFQIDTTPPLVPSISFVGGDETDNPSPSVIISATDALSGIDYYKIWVENGPVTTVAADTIKNNPFVLPWQDQGKRILSVEVFDRAGNSTLVSKPFVIDAPPSSWLLMYVKITKLLTVLVPPITLLLLSLLSLGMWIRNSKLKKRLRKEVYETDSALHKAFDLMKENVREQVIMLEKISGERRLTIEEERIIKQLRKDLSDAELYIRKEIKDIEKELK